MRDRGATRKCLGLDCLQERLRLIAAARVSVGAMVRTAHPTGALRIMSPEFLYTVPGIPSYTRTRLDRRSGHRGQEVEALAGRRRVSATRVRLKPRPPMWDRGATAPTMIKAREPRARLPGACARCESAPAPHQMEFCILAPTLGVFALKCGRF